jgi:zinc transport system substrate-binding protein
VKGFQPPSRHRPAGPDRAIDVSAGLPLLGADPHVWLDPANMATIGTTVGERLAEIEPAAATGGGQQRKLSEAMTNLDSQFTTGWPPAARANWS